MASPAIYQKISQRVKNAGLKLTTDAATFMPFIRRLNAILNEFDAEKALELKFRAPWQEEAQINKPIESARVRAAILGMSKADFDAALEATPQDQKKIQMATSILTTAIPTDYDFLWEEKDHPVKIYSALGQELFPGDAHATNDLWDQLDEQDLDGDYDGNVIKLAAAINAIHNRLKDAGESLSVGRKISALIKALKPKSKFSNVIFEMKKQPWKSFTKAVSRLQEVIKTWQKIKEEKPKQEEITNETSSSSSSGPNGKWVPLDANNETLMFQRFKASMTNGGGRGDRGPRRARESRRPPI